jgi:ParB family transcriptional regulator, chromosome partitioning protein
MTKKKRGLGKNRLDVFLSNSSWQASDEADVAVAEPSKVQAPIKNGLLELPVEALQRGEYQPRKHMDDETLLELSASIKAQGVIQPILVRKLANDRYEIIAGERRWRAARMAGLDAIPAIIKETTDEAAMAMALIENIQREDLNPIEEALAIQRLVDEFALTQQKIGETLGKSRTTITNLLRLLTLVPKVRDLLSKGKIDMGHAKVLLSLEEDEQSRAADIICLRGLTVRETEDMVRRIQGNMNVTKKPNKIHHPVVQSVEADLKARLKTTVKIQHNPTGKGKVQIHYKNIEELEALLDRIQ